MIKRMERTARTVRRKYLAAWIKALGLMSFRRSKGWRGQQELSGESIWPFFFSFSFTEA